MRLVHLSDIHHQLDWTRRTLSSTGLQGLPGRFELQVLGRLARFHAVEARLGQLVDDLHALAPDHVVLTGDLTALGHEEELEPVRELLAPFLEQRRLTVVPGNHDRYTDGPGGRGLERLFAGALESDLPEHATSGGYPFARFLGDELVLVGLDSTRVRGWAQYILGKVGDEQLKALERLLDDPRVRERSVLLLLHHGPFGPGGGRDWREAGLLDAKKLMRVLRGRNVVVHHGHSHHRFWHRAQGHRPHIFGGGSATEPGREGYWLLEVDDHLALEARHLRPGREPLE